MKARHTPGPWSFIASPNCWSVLQVGSSGRWVIAGGTAWAIPGRQSEAEANARLIAAAPDMLDALISCFTYLSFIPESAAGGDDDAVMLAKRARAAIAKATEEAA